ncbi:MAG: hypothetical protein IT542_07365 [Rubellimicrobium sp.]|nr:hypothetical protein [Rubellimicrobium sp.]
MQTPTRTRIITIAAAVAVVFGILTIVSGARALFGPGDPGAAVPFVLWFNFVAGFAYVLAGIGLWLGARWAPALALVIAVATVAVFAAFLWHVTQGDPWMGRTMGAMVLRAGVWIWIALVARRAG